MDRAKTRLIRHRKLRRRRKRRISLPIVCSTHKTQLTSDWCVQACLESFLTDNSVTRTQEEMVQLGVKNKVCVESGVIPYDEGKTPNYRNLIDFCDLVGIDL